MRRRRRRAYDPEGDGNPLRTVGESIAEIGRGLGLADPTTNTLVFGDWAGLVGEGIAAHARPRTARGGVLTVAVDSPAWATQVRHLEGEILARLAARGARDVEALRVVVDPAGPRR